MLKLWNIRKGVNRSNLLVFSLSALLLLFTSSTFAQSTSQKASDPVKGAAALVVSPQLIEGQYIVTFDDSESAAEVAAQLSAERGSEVVIQHVYSAALNGFAASLSKAALRDLQARSSTILIEPDQVISIAETQNNATWGLDRIDQRNLPLSNSYSFNQTGADVDAYIIDTGILDTHAEFGGRVLGGYDAIGDGNGYVDCQGHGTHVAGTVAGSTYGVAKDAALYAVRVLDCSGSGSNAGVIAGVDWVTSQHNASGRPSVANMSLGGGASTALDNAVRNSIAAGVTYAVAAGNETQDACTPSPARVDQALTVGSSTSSDARSSFSNFGTCVDIFAPGSGITSAWSTGNAALNTISGTSMASPHVAGAAALYLQAFPAASPAQVFAELTGTATQGVLSNVGTGSPNLLLCSGVCEVVVTPTPTPPPDGTFCSAGSTSLVDGGTASSTISINDGRSISDVNVSLDVSHSWVGDLTFELSHSGTGQSIVLVDRIGVPASTYGCSGDGIDVTLDDEASSDVEGACASGSPAVSGSWQPASALSSLDGALVDGDWLLTVTDSVTPDGGSLTGWCLAFELDDGPAPTTTPAPPTATPEPTSVPPTATLEPTSVPPTATLEPTSVPPTATPEPTSVPPTATPEPTSVPPTATPEPTSVPPTATPEPTSVPPTATPEPTSVPPTATPEPTSGDVLYLSFNRNANLGGITFRDEDIIEYDLDTDTATKLFDGSVYGITSDVDAFVVMPDNTILLSLVAAYTVPGAGMIDDSDIVSFDPATGLFSMYFDGSDVGLTTNAEDVDALAIAGNGNLIISTTGTHRVNGTSLVGRDEDMIVFNPTTLGETTSGSFVRLFDGSDVGLNGSNAEDSNAVFFDSANGNIYLSTRGDYAATGLSGNIADVFVCDPTSVGSSTGCDFSLFWRGTDHGVATNNAIDGLQVKFGASALAANSAPTAVGLDSANISTTLPWIALSMLAALGLITARLYFSKRP